MRHGSYHQGFAPRDGAPRYPQLWRGCVGAWAPCLGPTGTTLRDWSGIANHGTISNATLATIWEINGGRYALSFDGSNDVALSDKTTGISGNATFSLSCWLKFSSPTTAAGVIGGGATATTLGAFGFFIALRAPSLLSFEFAGNNGAWSLFTFSANTWYHLVAQKSPGAINTTTEIYINSVRQTLTAAASANTPNITNTVFSMGRWADYVVAQSAHTEDDVRLYNRVLAPQEIALLASRRGIAYEMAERRWAGVEGGFNAAWARGCNSILVPGVLA